MHLAKAAASGLALALSLTACAPGGSIPDPFGVFGGNRAPANQAPTDSNPDSANGDAADFGSTNPRDTGGAAATDPDSTAAPDLTTPGDPYTTQNLEAALEAADITPESEETFLDRFVEQTIDPEECALAPREQFVIKDSPRAQGLGPGGLTGEITTLPTVASAEGVFDQYEGWAEACPTYTVEAEGETFEGTASPYVMTYVWADEVVAYDTTLAGNGHEIADTVVFTRVGSTISVVRSDAPVDSREVASDAAAEIHAALP